MLYVYAVISAALIPVLDRFFGVPILRQPYSLWLVPVMFVGTFLALVILTLGAVIIAYLFVDLGKPPRACRFYRKLTRFALPFVCQVLRIKVKSTGDEVFPESGRFVLVSNHTHLLDPVVYLGYYPEKDLAFIGKKEIVKSINIVAKVMWSTKGIFIDRDNLRSGAKGIIDSIRMLKNGEVSMGIFPEGTRSKDGSVGEFKSGAVKIARKSGVPIVVCSIKGVTDVMHRFPFRSTTVYIDVLKRYDPDEIAECDDESVSLEARQLISDNLEKRNKEE